VWSVARPPPMKGATGIHRVGTSRRDAVHRTPPP
jgi:hypothetical protein